MNLRCLKKKKKSIEIMEYNFKKIGIFPTKNSNKYSDIKKFFKSLPIDERNRELLKLRVDIYFMEYEESKKLK